MANRVNHMVAAATPKMWHVIDAKGQIIGRLAPQIAKLLMGKHKPIYRPSLDVGDYVVVINAADAVFTGNKMKTKLYRWHTGWMGGLKELTARQMHERAPERLLEHAVKGMMPPNHSRYEWLRRLRVVAGPEHKHLTQTGSCAEYAPSYFTTFKPRGFMPPPAEETGALVKDVFPDTRSDSVLEARAKAELVEESKEEALRKLREYLATQRAATKGGELR